jgi:hypothetical protein
VSAVRSAASVKSMLNATHIAAPMNAMMRTAIRGEQVATSRLVAVKRVRAGADQDVRTRFRRELAALLSIDHPNVVDVIDVVERDDEVALIQPLMAGTLADRLANDGALGPVEVAELGADLARGLAALHAAGVLHRDVKPSNVLIDHEGVPRLGDLGVALVRDDGAAAVVGTAEYLAPEVAVGGEDHAGADVYALGVTLYEAMTGVPPYAGSTVAATLRAADRGVHVPLRDAASTAPPSLSAAVERAFARRPERRWRSAGELAAALDAARLDALATPGGDPPPAAHETVDGAPPHRPPAPTPPAQPVSGAAAGSGGAKGERSGGTRLFGARPPAPPPPDVPVPGRGGRPRWLVPLVAAVVLVPLLVLGSLVLLRDRDPRPDTSPVVSTSTDVTPTAAPTLETCRGAVEPTVPAGGEVLRGDLADAGCATFATWEGGVLTVYGRDSDAPVRFRVGSPTDRLLLGDFDCDGVDAPAIYRPQDGTVFIFDGLAGEGELTSRPGVPSGRPNGTPRVVDRDGCDEIVVAPPD